MAEVPVLEEHLLDDLLGAADQDRAVLDPVLHGVEADAPAVEGLVDGQQPGLEDGPVAGHGLLRGTGAEVAGCPGRDARAGRVVLVCREPLPVVAHDRRVRADRARAVGREHRVAVPGREVGGVRVAARAVPDPQVAGVGAWQRLSVRQ